LIIYKPEVGTNVAVESSDMRIILGAVCFVIAATPAFAQCALGCRGPAPLLGLGIPAAVAVGGALLGVRFFKKK